MYIPVEKIANNIADASNKGDGTLIGYWVPSGSFGGGGGESTVSTVVSLVESS